ALALDCKMPNPAGGLAQALRFAKEVGLPKLEAGVHRGWSAIALAEGDLERASRNARRALAIAAACGMGLRVTSGLVALGNIARSRRRHEVATKVYRAAVDLARRQGYYLQMGNAQARLLSDA